MTPFFSSFSGQFRRVGSPLSSGANDVTSVPQAQLPQPSAYLHQPTHISLPLATTVIDHSPLLLFGGWGEQIFIHSFMNKGCLFAYLGGYGIYTPIKRIVILGTNQRNRSHQIRTPAHPYPFCDSASCARETRGESHPDQGKSLQGSLGKLHLGGGGGVGVGKRGGYRLTFP